MKVLDKINVFRRKMMKGITSGVGSSSVYRNIPKKGKAEIKKVLICRPNHRLGNLLLITPLIQEVAETFPGCKIDLFVKGYLPQIVYKNYPNIHQIIHLPRKPFESLLGYLGEWTLIRKTRYDMVINVDSNSSSGRLATQFANARYRFFGYDSEEVQSSYPDYRHVAKYPVYNFREFLGSSDVKNDRKIFPLDLRLSPEELNEGRNKLKNIVSNEKRTICLFTFATRDKCYPKEWWSGFYEKLEAEFADDYNIIEILPVENVSQLSFKIPSFYSKDIREIGAVIASTILFIGADSGIMHLASSVHTPTVGLFSVTDESRYGPYANKSRAINTNKNDQEEIVRMTKSILKSGYN